MQTMETSSKSGMLTADVMESRHVVACSAITALLFASALVFHTINGPKSLMAATSYHSSTLLGFNELR